MILPALDRCGLVQTSPLRVGHAVIVESMTNAAKKINLSDLSCGDILVTLSASGAGAEISETQEIKIAPRGKTATRDGRAYDFDPELLVSRFEADGIEIPVDLEHSLSSFGNSSQGAIGWIAKLMARPDGLYGEVAWLGTGIEILKARSHRYLSPTFKHDEFGKASWLHSVALVAAPALSKQTALANAQPNHEEQPMSLDKLAAKLGLQESASEDALLSALETRLDNSVDKSVHDEAVAKLTAATGELASLKEADHKAKVDALLEAALKDKKIVPAQRDHYEKLCAAEDGLEQVTALLAASTPGLSKSGLDDASPPGGDGASDQIDPVQLAAKANAYQGEMADKGVTVPIEQAVLHVQSQK